MQLTEMKSAIQNAEQELFKAECVANDLARVLKGRLKNVTGFELLRSLKKELKNYNSNTRQWK